MRGAGRPVLILCPRVSKRLPIQLFGIPKVVRTPIVSALDESVPGMATSWPGLSLVAADLPD
jgi:hypothetical protein